jgi:hypothetical protein
VFLSHINKQENFGQEGRLVVSDVFQLDFGLTVLGSEVRILADRFVVQVHGGAFKLVFDLNALFLAVVVALKEKIGRKSEFGKLGPLNIPQTECALQQSCHHKKI